jgi:hemolysin III
MHDDQLNVPPEPTDEEWANATTHGIGIAIALAGLFWMMSMMGEKPLGLLLSCLVYCVSVLIVFVFSTLSHLFNDPSLRTHMRSWDQGTIYMMISGTYTPFVWQFGGWLRTPLMIFIWGLALYGLWQKVVVRRQVNAMVVTTYLLLGWIPAVPLAPQVPWGCLGGMALGGVIYSGGVFFLMFDHVGKFFHSVWHLAVIAAAVCHYLLIVHYVVQA